MGSALTNVSLPILLNRKQQSNHPNFELPNINVFLEDRREHSLLFVHLMLDSHCLRQAPNLTSYSHPKLLFWLLFLHCLRDERWAAQRRVPKQIHCHKCWNWHTEAFWRKFWFQILQWESKRWEIFQKVQSLPQRELKNHWFHTPLIKGFYYCKSALEFKSTETTHGDIDKIQLSTNFFFQQMRNKMAGKEEV